MEIGFIGLDAMGFKMILGLLAEGHKIRICESQLPVATLELERRGAQIVPYARDLGASDIVINMLDSEAHIQTHIYGEDGLLKNLKYGSVHLLLGEVNLETQDHLLMDHALIDTNFMASSWLELNEKYEALLENISRDSEGSFLESLRELWQTLIKYFGLAPCSQVQFLYH